MPRWVVILIVAPLALCVTCGSLGYVAAWPAVRDAVGGSRASVSAAMADAVAASVSDAIVASAPRSGTLALTAADLDVNNADGPGGCGVEVSKLGSTIYGFATEIGPGGIAIVCGDIAYSGVPIVEGGRVELTAVAVSNEALGWLFPKDRFADGMAGGINRALTDHGLTPTEIALGNGVMMIRVGGGSRSAVAATGTPGAVWVSR